MKPTIYLFDVDGTLCRTGGAGGRAMRRAFAEVHGRPDAMDVVDVRGNTDPNIVEEALRAIGEEAHPRAFETLMMSYLRFLEEELEQTTGYLTMPGVVPLLDAVGRGSHAVGLGTGNVEPGARAKLRRGGIDQRFSFGGFGSDARERAILVARGADRGALLLGRPRAECRVVVLGDTPRDVEAAKAIGAESIAVATGGYTLDELMATEATLTVPTLEHPDVYRLLDLPVVPR